jgi:hypothetical protein
MVQWRTQLDKPVRKVVYSISVRSWQIFYDLLRQKPSSLFISLGWSSISVASVMMRFMYLVLVRRMLVLCSCWTQQLFDWHQVEGTPSGCNIQTSQPWQSTLSTCGFASSYKYQLTFGEIHGIISLKKKKFTEPLWEPLILTSFAVHSCYWHLFSQRPWPHTYCFCDIQNAFHHDGHYVNLDILISLSTFYGGRNEDTSITMFVLSHWTKGQKERKPDSWC